MSALKQLISPFFLRREKTSSIKSTAPSKSFADGSDSLGALAAVPEERMGCATQKIEIVVWTRLSAIQQALYAGFLESEEVKVVLNTTDSPLAAIGVLKKICCHPLLLNERARKATALALDTAASRRPEGAAMPGIDPLRAIKELEQGEEAFQAFAEPTEAMVEKLLQLSGKLVFLMQLLDSHKGMVSTEILLVYGRILYLCITAKTFAKRSGCWRSRERFPRPDEACAIRARS